MDGEKLEHCVVKIILKIKKNRNRPCYQNILTLVNRDGIDINMDNLKEMLHNMIENGLLRNNGKEGRESFFVIDEQDNDSDDVMEERSLEDCSNKENIEDILTEDGGSNDK